MTGRLAKQLGTALSEERTRQGKTLRQLAEEIGVSNPTLHTYEHGGSNLTFAKAEELAKQYGLEVSLSFRRKRR